MLLAVVRHFHEKAHDARCVARSQDAANLHAAEFKDLAVLQFIIKGGDLLIFGIAPMHQRASRILPNGFRTHRTDGRLGPIQRTELICRAKMVKVLMGMQDPPHIRRIKAQSADALRQQMRGVVKSAVQQDQTLGGFDQMEADLFVAYIIQAVGDPERLNKCRGRMGIKRALRIPIPLCTSLHNFLIPSHICCSLLFCHDVLIDVQPSP